MFVVLKREKAKTTFLRGPLTKTSSLCDTTGAVDRKDTTDTLNVDRPLG